MNRNTARWGFCVCAVVCGFFVLAACDDFNRSLEDDIDFYPAVKPVSSWAELKSAAEDPSGPGLIGLTGDIEVDATITITRPLTVTGLEGRRVIRRGTAFTANPLFQVTGDRLTLGHPKGGTLVLDGGGIPASAPLVSVGTGGALTLLDGAALQNNNHSSGDGGGVAVNGGSFEMEGGTISGNTISDIARGGGVFVGAGSFTMSGGTISGNTGGGVEVYVTGSDPATFTMSGGTISNNSAAAAAGVMVGSSSALATFIMSGGTISNNSASGIAGGGVYVSTYGGAAVFTMSGNAAVSGNRVSSSSGDGGGVYVGGSGGGSSTFTMSGNAAVSGNSVRSDGGGVFVGGDGGVFTMNGGTISGNSANGSESRGGGVSIGVGGGGGVFTMNGGTISGNSANGSGSRGDGGGVYVGGSGSGSGDFTMNGGTISGNSANGVGGSGGGVYVGGSGSGSGDFTMNGGTISGNSANGVGGRGGGVYANSGSFKKEPETPGGTSGVIYGSNGGENSNLVKDGSGNPVDDRGHAVYVSGSKKWEETVSEYKELDSTQDGTAGGWDS